MANTCTEIKAYPLYNHIVTIRPSPNERTWAGENQSLYQVLSLSTVNSQGWDLLCPYTFEAMWNGGPDAQDIDIRFDKAQVRIPGFVQSHLGDGILTFHPGYQFKTAGDSEATLWVRGPINRPKDGLYPLESIVDISMLPCTITVNWRFTRPNQMIRFEEDEPFGALLPYPRNYAQAFEGKVIKLPRDPQAYERELAQMIKNPTVQEVFRRLAAAGKGKSVVE